MMSIVADFGADWVEFLRSCLIRAGYAVNPNDDQHKISVKFFNVLRRQIGKRPRRVLKATEFSCPANLEAEVEKFILEAERGDDLTPRLSLHLLDADFNDGLLNEWDIHHFHFGSEPHPKNPKFIGRSDNLLFARVTEDTIYLLDVADHKSWSRQQFVEVLHRNWPESIERYRLAGVVGLERSLSDSDVAKLRAAGVSLPVQISGGTVYDSIGGGIATSGRNIQVVRQSDYYFDRVRALERDLLATKGGVRSCLLLFQTLRGVAAFCGEGRGQVLSFAVSDFARGSCVLRKSLGTRCGTPDSHNASARERDMPGKSGHLPYYFAGSHFGRPRAGAE